MKVVALALCTLSLLSALTKRADAADSSPGLETLKLAASTNNGLVKLDPELFDLMTSPSRKWSATIQFTAMSKNMKCAPCK